MVYDTKQPLNLSDLIPNARLLIPALRLQHAIETRHPSRPAVGVCLGGDSEIRLRGTVALYQSGRIDRIIVSGGIDDPRTDNLTADAMKQSLVEKHIPMEVIHAEGKSRVTDHHPIFVNPIIREMGHQDVIVITSRFHLLRAYLRFLEELRIQNFPYKLYGHSVGGYSSCFQRTPTQKYPGVLDFYLVELTKIRTYRRLAALQEAWEYVHFSVSM